MKIESLLIKLLLCLMLFMIIQCEYDVTQPLWYQDYPEPPIPSISNIVPDEATPGWNYIKIFGSNFIGKTTVYFDNVKAKVVAYSNDSVVVRRPAISKDSCIVKVVCDSALVVAKYSPYKIHQVIEPYGNFLENKQLNAVAVDADENIYVVENENKYVYKITPSGDKTIVGTVSRVIYDVAIGPDGNLYFFGNNRAIDVLDLQTEEMSQWIRLKSGKVVMYGDFTANGYLVTGGRRSGLVVVSPDKEPIYTEYHVEDEIVGIRVYNGYVYVNVVCDEPDENNPEFAIWRHSIDSEGNIGDKELILDLTDFIDEYHIDQANSFYFGENGKLFIGISSENSLLVYDFNNQTMDFFYLDIVPSYCKYFAWGNQTYIYLIRGDTALEEEWTMYRIDMGINKGSK